MSIAPWWCGVIIEAKSLSASLLVDFGMLAFILKSSLPEITSQAGDSIQLRLAALPS